MTAPVECEGAPRDLGGAQGRACRDALRAHCRSGGLWTQLVAGLSPGGVVGSRALRDVRRHFPHQAEQLEGIARGAGLPLGRIGRAMLSALAGPSHGASLALTRSGAPLVARPILPGALLRRTRPEGRFRTLELTLAPLTTALLGVNEMGLALACDSGPLQTGGEACAAPAALLARDCLERFAAVEAALEWCVRRPAAQRAAILVADASGAVAGVEIAGGARRVLRPENGVLLPKGVGRSGAGLSALGHSSLDAPAVSDGLAAAFGPDVPPFALADPVGRRIRVPGVDAAWVGL